MDPFTVFNIVVLAVFVLILMGLLVNAVLNSPPLHPKQPHGFEAIEKAIEKYDAAWAANNWRTPYSRYHRILERMNRRGGQGNQAREQSNTK